MSWNAGALGAMMGFGQGLEQVGGMLMQGIQKKQQAADENEVWMKRQAMIQSLKPPETRQVKVDDPDHPGRSLLQTQAYQPPDLNDPSSKGTWNVVSTEHVQPKYVKDTQTLPGDMKQDILYNENDPTDVHPLGAPAHIFNPEDARYHNAELVIRGAELGLSGQRLGLEGRRVDIEAQRAASEKKAANKPGTYDFGDDLQGVGVIDPETNTFKPAKLPSGQPMIAKRNKQNVAMDEFGNPVKLSLDDYNQLGSTDHSYQQQGTPSMYAGVDPDYAQQQVGVRTPMSQLSGSAIDAGGSGAQQTPRPAQASTAATGPGGAGPTPQASAQGKGQPKLQINRSTGQKRYVYPDGTIVPVGQ